MDSSELTKNKRNRVTANSLSGGGIARPHSNITMNSQVLSSYRLGSRLVSHNKYLVLPFCQPPLCDTDLGTNNGNGDDTPFIDYAFPCIAPSGVAIFESGTTSSVISQNLPLGGIYSVINLGVGDSLSINAVTGELTSPSPFGVGGTYEITYTLNGNIITTVQISVQPGTCSPLPIVEGWATNIGNSNGNEGEFTFNATDKFGNIYVVGPFNQTTAPFPTPDNPLELYDFDFLDTNGIVQTTVGLGTLTGGTSAFNVYLTKYDEFGDVIWATKILSDQMRTYPEAISVDENGDVYVSLKSTGTNSSTPLYLNFFDVSDQNTPYGRLQAPFQPNPTQPVPSVQWEPEFYGILVKYDTNGECQWVTKLQNMNNAGNGKYQGIDYQSLSLIQPFSNSPTPPQDIVLTGRFGAVTAPSANQLPPQTAYPLTPPYQVYLYNAGTSPSLGGIITPTIYGYLEAAVINSGFIVKYDENGLIKWATYVEIDTTGSTPAQNIPTRLSKNISNAYQPFIPAPNHATYVLITMVSSDPLLTYYNATQIPPSPLGSQISVGDAYSFVPPSSIFSTGSMYIAKYDVDGLFQWSNYIKAGQFSGTQIQGADIVIDRYGDGIYVTGSYSGENIQLFSWLNNTLNTPGPPDFYDINVSFFATMARPVSPTATGAMFVLKYDNLGIAKLSTQIYNPSSPPFQPPIPKAMTMDRLFPPNFFLDKLTIVGRYEGPLVIDKYLQTQNIGQPSGQILTSPMRILPYTVGPFNNIFMIQFDINCQLQWATSIDQQTGGPDVSDISSDNRAGQIIITGLQTRELLFNNNADPVPVPPTPLPLVPPPVTTTLWGKLPVVGGSDAFIVKYKRNGQVGL